MKKLFKQTFAIIMTVAMIFTIAPLGVFANEADVISGTCGMNLTWTFNKDNGLLEISGAGKIPLGDIEGVTNWPYGPQKDEVKEIKIADDVTGIENYAFQFCNNLTSVIIGNSVKTIGTCAFYNCESLKNIEIGNSVTRIEMAAFQGCKSLESVTIPDSVKTIDYDVFRNCENLKTVKISASVTDIGAFVFKGCTSLESITVDKNNEYYSSDSSGVLFNKDKTSLIQYPIGNTKAEYFIPSSVTVIEAEAFFGCENLESVHIPESVSVIASSAFENCKNLAEISTYEFVDSIGSSAFENTKYYNNPDNWINGVLYLDEYVIRGSGTLSGNVSLRGETLVIADGAFVGCNKFTDIVIPYGVTRIGDSAFYGCESLKSVTIVNEQYIGTAIGSYAFYNCKALSEITIADDNFSYIGKDAFTNTEYYNNDSNWSGDVLYIGNRLIKARNTLSGAYIIKDKTQTIADSAFLHCTNLIGITIPESVKYIGSSAFSYCNFKTVTIPDEVARINDSTFFGCHSLTSITIGNAVRMIGDQAFNHCDNLTSITLPTKLQKIGDLAFGGCSYLTDVFYFGSEDNWKEISIGGANEDLTSAIIHYLYSPNGDMLGDKTTRLVSLKNTVNGPKLTWKEVDKATGYYVYRRTSDTTWIRLGSTAETSFADKTAKSGTDYIYTAKAYNDISTSRFQSGLKIKCLDSPKITLIRNSTRGVRIEWEPVEGATGYVVYDKDVDCDYYNRSGTTTETFFEYNRKMCGTTSYFTVRACYDGENTMSSYRAGTKIKYLVAPTVLSVDNTTLGVRLVWNKINGASTYHIYRKTANGSYSRVGTTTARSFTDTTAKSGTTYYYTVRASYGTTLSSFRAGSEIKYLTSPTVSSAVNTVSGVKISWNNIAGASTYHIYRKTSATGSYSRVGTSKTTSFTDTTAKKGTTYYYTVRASYGLNLSSYRVGTKVTIKK